ncbi:unnamed protein product [Bemisia tabaci]|uniref:Uncharacterized protein n=1 Tax=Bemisia tabaci TaxID=7038 RepID=A0A9P0A9Q9_BEMTA|nr:unnamed protein product [Bemisia tabaci]
MKIDFKPLLLILTTCHAMTISLHGQDTATQVRSVDAPPKHLDGVLLDRNLILNQPTQALLWSALATVVPLFGRIVRVVPYVATGVNTITGTINSGISAGFAIPIEDEFVNYGGESKSFKGINIQQQHNWTKMPLRRTSRNHL